MEYSKPTAKVILDSTNPYTGTRITTFEGRMHRFILPEKNAHRAHSRNSASSRAIPITKQIERVLNDLAMPLHWGKNQAGMSAREELPPELISECQKEWLKARDNAVESAQRLTKLGLHKQVINRLLEPFMWHTIVFTTTEIQNFFNQRCHPDAQPEMQAFANAVRDSYISSTPISRHYHIPYIVDGYTEEEENIEELTKIGVARCARTSYLSHDGKIDVDKDLELYEKLRTANPPHLSPFEHVAVCSPKASRFANFNDWISIRYIMENTQEN
jgi:thymidylate synthase ThyX